MFERRALRPLKHPTYPHQVLGPALATQKLEFPFNSLALENPFFNNLLAQLQAAFFNWFIDYTNWNGVLMALSEDGKADLGMVKTVSAILMEHTEKTMALIDEYCGSPRATKKTGGER